MPRTLDYLGRIFALGTVYFVVSGAALLLSTRDGLASAFWLPAGLGLFWLFRFGLRQWPGIVLGALVVSRLTGTPLEFAIGAALGKALEAVVAAFLLRRADFRPALDRLSSVLALVLTAVLSGAIGATLRDFATLAVGPGVAEPTLSQWAIWWSGDAIGMLIATPLLFAWTTSPDPTESARWRSAGGVALLTGGVAGLILLIRGDSAYLFGVFIIITGAAFHFGRRAVTAAVAITAAVASWHTLHGVGAFVMVTRPSDLVLLQLFCTLLPIVSLSIAAGLTQRREVTARLEGEAAQFAAAQQLARFGTWRWTLGSGRVTWSPELSRIYGSGTGRGDGSLDDWLAIVHPDDRALVRAAGERATSEGGGFHLHKRIVRPDGQMRTLTSIGRVIRDASNTAVAIVGVSQDITEQWHLETVLREREEFLRAVFDRSAVGIVLTDLHGRFMRVNQAYCKLMGYSAEELLQLSMQDVTHPADCPRIRPLLEDLIEGRRERVELEKRNRRKDGSLAWVRVYASLMPDEHGTPRYIIGLVENVDQRKRAEEELYRVQEAYREMVEWAPLGVFRATRNGRILLANRAMGMILRCRSDGELRSLDLRRDVMVDPQDWDRLVSRFEQNGQPHQVELQWKRRDGTPIWVELRSHVVRDAAGRLKYFENFLHDITERRLAESVLADEKAVLELLARGVDLNEVLERLCRMAETWAPGMQCSVLLLEAGTRLRPASGPQLPSSLLAAIDSLAIGPDDDGHERSANGRAPVVLPDLEQSPLWVEHGAAARAAGVRACWSVPIRDGEGLVVGTFAMYYREPWRPSAREWQLIERASQLAGLAIERARRTAELRRRSTELQISEQRYRVLASQLPDAGVALFDRDLRVLLSEGAVLARTDRGERLLFDIVPPLAAESVVSAATGVFAGRSVEFEVEDRQHAYLLRLLPVRDEQDQVASGMVLVVDLTERRRHERVRRQLLGRLTDAQEQERRRIAREVHDEAGQSLTALLVGLRMLRSADSVEAVRLQAEHLHEIAAETLENLGRLARGLHPSVLDDMGLPPAVSRYAREYATHYHIPVNVRVEGFEGRRLGPELEATLYRIVLEALTNTARHSHASGVEVQLRRAEGWVEAVVRDDGQGFDAAAALHAEGDHQPLGLHGIRERAEFLGGTAGVASSPGNGTVITVRVPVGG